MACLRKSRFLGRIVWLGRVSGEEKGIRSVSAQTASADFDGVIGEAHSGATRPACVRVQMLHPKGTEIRNTRQVSLLSAEENAGIAADLGLDWLNPEWLGASLVIEGIPDFSHLPPGSRLQTPAGTTLTVDLENAPCNFPAQEIEKDRPGSGKRFKAVAENRRGVTAWVERPGPLTIDDEVRLFVPSQPAWAPT